MIQTTPTKSLTIREDVPLAPCTTLRIGGPARFFAAVRSESELLEALAFADSGSLPVFILGGGSNLLLPDAGFPGLVLHATLAGEIHRVGHLLEVPAGIEWDPLVLHLCQQGISGMECLAGIPGLVGGAPIQNIGAYGQEAAETIHSVRAYDRQSREFTTLTHADCQFAYRSSLFNTTDRNRYIVTQVTFALDPAATPNLTYADLRKHFPPEVHPTPLEVYHAVRQIRAAKGMLLVEGDPDCRSAGSFFKNPIVPPSALPAIAQSLGIPETQVPRYPAPYGQVKLPAAWLLDQAGFHKSFTLGEAGISSRHTLALINRGRATYADIARLRALIVETIQNRFHIVLEQEPVEIPQ